MFNVCSKYNFSKSIIFCSKPRKVEIQQIEIENRENIAIKRKFNHKIPCRNKRKRKKVLPTTKQFDSSNQQAVDGRLPKIDQTKNNKFLGTKTATWTSKSAEESLGNKKVPRRDANESIVSSSVDQQTSKELTLMRDHKATTEVSYKFVSFKLYIEMTMNEYSQVFTIVLKKTIKQLFCRFPLWQKVSASELLKTVYRRFWKKMD